MDIKLNTLYHTGMSSLELKSFTGTLETPLATVGVSDMGVSGVAAWILARSWWVWLSLSEGTVVV